MAMMEKLGSKFVSVLLLLVMLLGVSAAVVFINTQANTTQQNTQHEKSQQIVNAVIASYQQQIKEWQQTALSLAELTETKQLANTKNIYDVDDWKNLANRFFPSAKAICLITREYDAPTNEGCLPISYVSLKSLRQLTTQTQADVAMIMQDGKADHILLAARIPLDDKQQYAAVAIALKPTDIQLINPGLVPDAYIEISQGDLPTGLLTTIGDSQYKQAEPVISQPIPNSYWQVKLWSVTTSAGTPLWLFLAPVMILIVLIWMLREWWQTKLLHSDANRLEEQLRDLQEVKLKTKYPLVFSELYGVRELIQQLAIPEKKQALPVEEPLNTFVIHETETLERSETLVETPPEVREESEAYDSDVIDYDRPYEQDAVDEQETFVDEDSTAPEQPVSSLSLDETVANNSDLLELKLTDDETPTDDVETSVFIEPEPSETEKLSLEPEIDLSSEPDDETKEIFHEDTQQSLPATEKKLELNPPSAQHLPDEAIFRAYDIRGIVGEQLTVPVMTLIGRAVGSQMIAQGVTELVVGHDGRLSSQPLAKAFMRGVTNIGQIRCPPNFISPVILTPPQQ